MTFFQVFQSIHLWNISCLQGISGPVPQINYCFSNSWLSAEVQAVHVNQAGVWEGLGAVRFIFCRCGGWATEKWSPLLQTTELLNSRGGFKLLSSGQRDVFQAQVCWWRSCWTLPPGWWASPSLFQQKCPQKYQGKKGTFPWAALVTEGAKSWQGKEEAAGGSDRFPWHVGIRMGMFVCSHCQLGPTAGLQGKPCPCSSATARTAGRRIWNESLWDFWQRSRACHLSPKRSQPIYLKWSAEQTCHV